MAEPAMAIRPFTTRGGRTLAFTALGFGGAPLGNMHRALGEDEAEEIVEAAWNAGLRTFDTAPLYGHSLSERRIGRALKSRPREAFVLSTKVGRLLEPCAANETDSGIYKAVPALRVRFDYSRDGVMRSYEESLKRLDLGRIDILFVHDIEARTHGGREGMEARFRELIDKGGWKALDELRRSGDVAAIGLGVNEWEPCARLLELADPDLFLLAGRYTLLEQEPLKTLFPQCAVRGVGVVAGGPFNSGVLAGKPSYDYDAVPARIAERVKALGLTCREAGTSLAHAALAFPLAHPVVASVIAGAQSIAEMRTNARLARTPVPERLWPLLKDRGLIDRDAPTAEKVAC